MQIRLEVSHDKANVKRVVLKNDAVIGRSADCNLRIASNQVSRRHCKLTITDLGVSVRDLESSNGTFLDGKPIPPNQDISISPGSELAIGPVRFVVRFESPQSELASRQEADTKLYQESPGTKIPPEPAAPLTPAEEQAVESAAISGPDVAEEEDADVPETTEGLPVFQSAQSTPDAEAVSDDDSSADVASAVEPPSENSEEESVPMAKAVEPAPIADDGQVEEDVSADAFNFLEASNEEPAAIDVAEESDATGTNEDAEGPIVVDEQAGDEQADDEVVFDEVDAEDEDELVADVDGDGEYEDVDEEDDDHSPVEGRRKKWSLFGLFGREKRNDDEAAEVNDEYDDEEPLETDGDDEVVVGEDDSDSGVAEPIVDGDVEEEAVASESAEAEWEENQEVDEDDVANFLSETDAEQTADPSSDDDDALGDFLKQLK